MLTLTQKVGWALDVNTGKSKQCWWLTFAIPDKCYMHLHFPFKLTDRQLRKMKKKLIRYSKVKNWTDPDYGYRYGSDFAKDKLFQQGFVNDNRIGNKKEFERLYHCQF